VAEQLIELAIVDCAAAKMEATTSPASPTGIPVTMKCGKTASPVTPAGRTRRAVVGEQQRADEEEDG
jgi:hypothetical protein